LPAIVLRRPDPAGVREAVDGLRATVARATVEPTRAVAGYGIRWTGSAGDTSARRNHRRLGPQLPRAPAARDLRRRRARSIADPAEVVGATGALVSSRNVATAVVNGARPITRITLAIGRLAHSVPVNGLV